MLAPWKKSYDQPRDHIRKQRHYFVNKGPSSQNYDFEVWELDHKESWALKNRCFWTVVLEKTLESPLDCKEIWPVHPKGNQSWIFTGRTDAEAETPILWPPDAKNWLIGKDPDAWKDWSQEVQGDDSRWDAWMASLTPSLTQQTWVWANSRSLWRTRKPGIQKFMGSRRIGHDWVTELNWHCVVEKTMARRDWGGDFIAVWSLERASRKRCVWGLSGI